MNRESGWVLLALLALSAHFLVVGSLFPGLVLELGRLSEPTLGYATFAGVWAVLGSIAALALARALLSLRPGGPISSLGRRIQALPDAAWISAAVVAAAGAALLARARLLGGASLTDDETAYRFASELLASGRLSVPSHPLKLFFDHPFFVNDGRFFPIYFPGWPALRALGVSIGLGSATNALLFALTVPAIFLVARRWVARPWAIATLFLFVGSPFFLVLAATDLSHTASVFALAWATHFFLRGREAERAMGPDAALALAFSVAFFVRPVAAAGVGLPLVLLWLRDRWRERPRVPGRWIAFGLISCVAATLFLAYQNELMGSPWKTGYQRMREYHLENGARFVPFSPALLRTLPGFDFGDLGSAFRRTSAGVFRLGFDLLGWPIGLLGLLAAVGRKRSAVPWAMLGGGVALAFFQKDVGIDSFGPVHWAELGLPAIWLLGIAGAGLARAGAAERRWAAAGVTALALVAWVGFVPVRWISLAGAARSAALPETMVRNLDLGRSVVFAPFPWVPPPCMSQPNRYFRWSQPVSDPDFGGEIVWAHHLDLEADRELMRHFPARRGVVLVWSEGCRLDLYALANATPASVPPGRLRLVP